MKTTAQQVLDVAASQIGYIEAPANHTVFGAWYGADAVPWCAEFVSWVLWTACHANGEASPLEGVQSDKGAAYCPYVVDWARKAGLWQPDPAPGRLALFDWGHDGVADHIGICSSSGDPYLTIEGNTSPADNSNGGMVMRRSRSNSQGYSLGFVAIDWAPSVPAPVAPAWPGRVFVLASPLMRGSDVRAWQQQMAARGWHITVDGVYGPASASVARQFQSEKGLVVDGQVGPVSWTAAWTSAVTA